jgi:4-diphosphocytidyl-2-C-methyl-D-erythritol kinase
MAVSPSGGLASVAGQALRDQAYAKVNLTLRVLGRRADGYHEIESLVVFADVADLLSLDPGPDLGLTVHGALAAQAGPDAENLVVKAAGALARHIPGMKAGHFTLDKRLPAQAGLGGGSADAAAALRLLARLNGLDAGDPRVMKAARETGADVPVCVLQQPRWMGGIGEVLSPPVRIPSLHAVLLRPDVALATKDVFAALNAAAHVPRVLREFPPVPLSAPALIAFLAARSNDLEKPAAAIAPAVAGALSLLRAQTACLLARMSGSGSACFGVFATAGEAADAKDAIAAAHPDWWVVQVSLGGGP